MFHEGSCRLFPYQEVWSFRGWGAERCAQRSLVFQFCVFCEGATMWPVES